MPYLDMERFCCWRGVKVRSSVRLQILTWTTWNAKPITWADRGGGASAARPGSPAQREEASQLAALQIGRISRYG